MPLFNVTFLVVSFTVTVGCFAEPSNTYDVVPNEILMSEPAIDFALIVNVAVLVPVYLPLPVIVTVAVPAFVLFEYATV